jgi:hypothetical protein
VLEDLLLAIDWIDKIISLVTVLFVIYKWWQDRKQDEKIAISFSLNGREILLENISIIRRHITRSEILGILGVIQKNSKERYNIDYLSDVRFFEDLYKIQKGTLNKLVIVVTDNELEQFNLKGTQ